LTWLDLTWLDLTWLDLTWFLYFTFAQQFANFFPDDDNESWTGTSNHKLKTEKFIISFS
jgi:hypothetical protein